MFFSFHREVHDLCTLLGYGADAICPYIVFETMAKLKAQNLLEADLTDAEIFGNYVAAAARGISKVMAKMGISTLHSYKVFIKNQLVETCTVQFTFFTNNFSWPRGQHLEIPYDKLYLCLHLCYRELRSLK